MDSTWRNRIVGSGELPPSEILANPKNWRVHPKNQRRALQTLFAEIGWVQQVIVNRTTGHLLDGHLRVELALEQRHASVPVLFVELTLAEEEVILATLDPLAALAETDRERLDDLLRNAATFSDTTAQMLREVKLLHDTIATSAGDEAMTSNYREQYGVIVICEDEESQERVYNDLAAQGYTCRVVVT